MKNLITYLTLIICIYANAQGSDTLLSIKGLDRGSHTLRITKADSNLTEVRLAQIFK